MIGFVAGAFAVAGLAAASMPVLIHLLSRPRARVVEWAATAFLRTAIRRSRKASRIRDGLLLVLRALCVLLLGVALARPYLANSMTTQATVSGQPVHLVLMLDNSLSMGYTQLDGSLLDRARKRAEEMVQAVPEGSKFTIIALCDAPGTGVAVPRPLSTKRAALDALKSVHVINRTGTASRALELAEAACRGDDRSLARRVVLVTDRQTSNGWNTLLGDRLARLPGLEIVPVAADLSAENTWVANVHTPDGVACSGNGLPTELVATIRYEGPVPRRGVEVTLFVDGVLEASRVVDLEPGQVREVTFAHSFVLSVASGSEGESKRLHFAAIEVALTPDRLPADDRCTRLIPVVEGIPIVFVDELGRQEEPGRGLLGETWPLRRLMEVRPEQPISAGEEYGGQPLFQIQHVKIDELSPRLIRDARLVVVAGVADPTPAVGLLREYVQQGGQLLLAAGGDTNPAAWTASAWLDGAGILPARLRPEPIGDLPEVSSDLKPFTLDPESFSGSEILPRTLGREERDDLLLTPFFFKALATELDDRSGAVVLASYANGSPFLLSRAIGRGRVILCTTGLAPAWNTLARTNAVLLLDVLARQMIATTFPVRNLAPEGVFEVPMIPEKRLARVRLTRPDGSDLSLIVDAMPGADHYAVHSPISFAPGLYRITTIIPANDKSPEDRREDSFALAVASDESDPRSLGLTSSGTVSKDGGVLILTRRIERIDAWAWSIGALMVVSLLELWFASRPLPIRTEEVPR